MIPLSKIQVSPQKEAQFKTRGIDCVERLAAFFPKRYHDFRQRTKISEVKEGDLCRVSGTIVSCTAYDRTEAVLQDETGRLSLTWFRGCWFSSRMVPGAKFTFCGKISYYRGLPVMVQPMFRSEDASELARICPVYPKINGMSDRYLQEKIAAGISCLAVSIPWSEQDAYARAHGLPDRIDAIRQMHAPSSPESWKRARRRIVFDQIYAFYEEMAHRKDICRSTRRKAFPKSEQVRASIASLPFGLTADQSKAVDTIIEKTRTGEGLHSLITGDVGCGKTAVAMLAAILAWENGYQSILMAPTQILAKQHYTEISSMVELLGIKTALLLGTTKAREKKAIMAGLADGSIHILIGTHAVLSKDLSFHSLGMTIVDEEHRFGTAQKALLEAFDKAGANHLSMTATPIPRSYASTIYGDSLDIISIETMPAGRKPVVTSRFFDRERVYEKLLEEVGAGHQCYVVCPFIEDAESERVKDVLSVETATGEIAAYCKAHAPGVQVGRIDGNMKKADIGSVVDRFVSGEISILVSTTIVEVGVNVPNATAIAIMDADRFGLSALHQLRGRVGRSGDQGYCYLVSNKCCERLQVLCDYQSGFKIAELDMELRGPGDILGEEQTGDSAIIQTILRWPKMSAKIREHLLTA